MWDFFVIYKKVAYTPITLSPSTFRKTAQVPHNQQVTKITNTHFHFLNQMKYYFLLVEGNRCHVVIITVTAIPTYTFSNKLYKNSYITKSTCWSKTAKMISHENRFTAL